MHFLSIHDDFATPVALIMLKKFVLDAPSMLDAFVLLGPFKSTPTRVLLPCAVLSLDSIDIAGSYGTDEHRTAAMDVHKYRIDKTG